MKIITPSLKIRVRGAGRAWPAGKPLGNIDLLLRHPDTKDKDPAFLQEMDSRIIRGYGYRKRFMTHLPGDPLLSSEETSESLAAQAVKQALAGNPHASPEAFVMGSTTSSRYTGSQATSVLGKFGLQIPAIEMKAGCSTSLATLHTAQAYLKMGYGSVLVSCAETLSKVVHPGNRETWFGLADGAAALWLENVSDQEDQGARFEVIKTVFSTDGRYVDLFTTPGSLPPTVEALQSGGYFLTGDGTKIKEISQAKYVEMVHALLPEAESRSKIRWIIPHQVNRGLIQEVVRESELAGEVLWSAEEFGNLGGASVLFTLAETLETQKFQKGDQILLMSVGGGLSYAAQLWQVL